MNAGPRSSPDAQSATQQTRRADSELVRRGLARSRAHASRLVRESRVLVDGRPLDRSSQPVTQHTAMTVLTDQDDPGYVSRASVKLAGALDALGADGPRVDGADCLDVGASTGGFTDVLLRRGARRVVALDVGHGQLVRPLRDDPRVHVIEGYNARSLVAADLPWTPRLVVCDVSFISLTLVLPPVIAAVDGAADHLVMVKPQFEVGRERLGQGGVVRDVGLHHEAIRTVVDAALAVGAGVRAVVPSMLPGPHGNREFFVWVTRAATRPVDIDDTISRAVLPVPDGSLPIAHRVTQESTRAGGRS